MWYSGLFNFLWLQVDCCLHWNWVPLGFWTLVYFHKQPDRQRCACFYSSASQPPVLFFVVHSRVLRIRMSPICCLSMCSVYSFLYSWITMHLAFKCCQRCIHQSMPMSFAPGCITCCLGTNEKYTQIAK